MGILLKLAFSRGGILVMAVMALFAWHTLDKGSAVRHAVVSFIAKEELAIAQAENTEIKRRLNAFRKSNEEFNDRQILDEQADINRVKEIQEYIENASYDNVCVANSDIISRLLNN